MRNELSGIGWLMWLLTKSEFSVLKGNYSLNIKIKLIFAAKVFYKNG